MAKRYAVTMPQPECYDFLKLLLANTYSITLLLLNPASLILSRHWHKKYIYILLSNLGVKRTKSIQQSRKRH